MALSAWQATIVNESGDVIPSASIEVTNEATGLTATIYANSGGGSLGNPFSAGTNGFARFYADAGSYTIIASDAGSGFSESFNNVRLGNAQGYDTGTAAGEIPTNGDLGTAAYLDTGTNAGEVPTNSDLPTFGTAAIKNVGTAPDEVPTNAILSTSVLAPDGDGSQLTGLPAGYTDADALSLFNASGSAPVYACRAWVNFNGTGTVAIRASGNVSSITDNGVGRYTVNFTTPMPDANYSVATSSRQDSDVNENAYNMRVGMAGAFSTTGVKVVHGYFTNTNAYRDCLYGLVSIFR